MTLSVATGQGGAAADSFISLADASAYHASMGNDTWAALAPDAQEQRLRRATAYMEQAYRMRWAGTRVTSTQALSSPRAWVHRFVLPRFCTQDWTRLSLACKRRCLLVRSTSLTAVH